MQLSLRKKNLNLPHSTHFRQQHRPFPWIPKRGNWKYLFAIESEKWFDFTRLCALSHAPSHQVWTAGHLRIFDILELSQNGSTTNWSGIGTISHHRHRPCQAFKGTKRKLSRRCCLCPMACIMMKLKEKHFVKD